MVQTRSICLLALASRCDLDQYGIDLSLACDIEVISNSFTQYESYDLDEKYKQTHVHQTDIHRKHA